jgi:LacI family transcriptional regulator
LKKEPQSKLRIKDIAELAQVSPGTVDRVLHNRGEVKEDTRLKILNIINDHSYTPNIIAKSLASKRNRVIAVLIPEATEDNPYWNNPLIGINQTAIEISDFSTQVETYTFNPAEENSFIDTANEILKSVPDGVVFNPAFNEASLAFSKNMEQLNIPFVFIDINLKNCKNLAYFGQDALKSGCVAAKLMAHCMPENATILIAQLAEKKNVTEHMLQRENGFRNFFIKNEKPVNIISAEIDLLRITEPESSLDEIFDRHPEIKGIFVPNSRVFKVAEYLENSQISQKLVIGYDLIGDNVRFLKSGTVDFLLGQKPEEQGRKSIEAVFNFIMTKKRIEKINYSPIDIILKENFEYY